MKKPNLREKSKFIAGIWIFYSVLELLLPTPGAAKGSFAKAGLFGLQVFKRILLALLMIANLFMTLSFVGDMEKK